MSKGYKTPDINLMTDGIIGLGAQGTRPLLGNSQLRPETSTSSELGVVYDDGAGLTGNLTAFHTRFRTSSTTRTWPIAAPAAAPFRVAWTWACGSATACRWTISRSA